MPEPKRLEPQPLCASDELKERGDAVTFDILEFGRSAQAFALRFEGVAVAYVLSLIHI